MVLQGSNGETDIENRLMDMGRGEERVRCMVTNMETYITICKLDAAAAAKSLQLCPTLCNPIDGSPPGSPAPGILQARTLEWVAISFSSA